MDCHVGPVWLNQQIAGEFGDFLVIDVLCYFDIYSNSRKPLRCWDMGFLNITVRLKCLCMRLLFSCMSVLNKKWAFFFTLALKQ